MKIRAKFNVTKITRNMCIYAKLPTTCLGTRLGCVWKSGGLNYNPLFIEGIGLTRGQRIVGILHLGYFDKAPEGKARTPITEKMEIIEG